jgi:hypothetical protein
VASYAPWIAAASVGGRLAAMMSRSQSRDNARPGVVTAAVAVTQWIGLANTVGGPIPDLPASPTRPTGATRVLRRRLGRSRARGSSKPLPDQRLTSNQACSRECTSVAAGGGNCRRMRRRTWLGSTSRPRED